VREACSQILYDGGIWVTLALALSDLEYSRATMKNRRAVIAKPGGPEVLAGVIQYRDSG
jgi:hypothetical protein